MKQQWLVGIMVVVGCSAESGWEGPSTPVNGIPTAGTYGQDQFGTGGAGGASGFVVGNDSSNLGNNDYSTDFVPVTGQEVTEGDEDENCGSVTLESQLEEVPRPANILVVFDRSGSMDSDWQGQPRYQAAGNALIAAIEPLQDLLTVGGQFFPSIDPSQASAVQCNPLDWTHWLPGGACLSMSAGSCVVTDITADDQINFVPAAQFIAELPDQWLLQGAGMTPLETGVSQADAAIASATLEGPIVVVIMTDGQPNCDTQQANVEAIIARWLQNGIKTYVIGLPGSSEAADLLNQLAVTGGTGAYLETNDPATLQAEISTIVTETIKTGLSSCDIELVQTEDADLEKLHLVVEENGQLMDVPPQLGGGGGGWSINADGSLATLTGQLCEDAKAGRFDTVRFDFGCVDLPEYIE